MTPLKEQVREPKDTLSAFTVLRATFFEPQSTSAKNAQVRKEAMRPVSDHHWLALWLLLVGGGLLAVDAWDSSIDIESTFAGVLLGAGWVWLVLVE